MVNRMIFKIMYILFRYAFIFNCELFIGVLTRFIATKYLGHLKVGSTWVATKFQGLPTAVSKVMHNIIPLGFSFVSIEDFSTKQCVLHIFQSISVLQCSLIQDLIPPGILDKVFFWASWTIKSCFLSSLGSEGQCMELIPLKNGIRKTTTAYWTVYFCAYPLVVELQ